MPLFKKIKKEKKAVEYKEVTQSELIYSKRSFGLVSVTGIVKSRPRVLTMKGLFSATVHEHATIFELDKGLKVYYPGIALIPEGEEVKVYGKFSPPSSLIASKIETKNFSFEIQTE
ncbi:MAG TPA: hypothetical protein ENO36_04690 [Fervidicoccus fontis]|uniref:Uncharacterized protein n=1 Tax=Fervidicoccus fontis TaxID=683846 RepID=A0A7C2ULQ3_9CREN|nr:hypothetical protein [Fervidicoccus fontis]